MDRSTSKPIRLKSMGGRSVADMLDALERKAAPTSDGRRRRKMWTQEFLASGKPGKVPG